ncbi:M61 family metallopeptidase [Flammeovirga sp. EKP202]|uniref:M61 family metallopeptidase n=1 Tax=Flammeovirga sp. EKP202 TaxID=2770592 RepID=UPI00165F9362|nr:M61 family metallopeptidase [Flammeovirga sp. EKP202]MBD0404296.1 M61 family metallopeptidase [Flammeovirga sp. EKP202]
MHYSIKINESHQYFLSIQLTFKADDDQMIIKLPLWRPGRYQVQNFAKNIRGLDTSKGKIQVKGRNEWLLSDIKKGEQVTVSYDYYARHQDAGGTWVSEQFCLINFIGCALVPTSQLKDKIEVELLFDKAFKTATSAKVENGTFIFEDFEELTETPILLGKQLHHGSFIENEVTHHIWLQGGITPDWEKIIKDFKAFTKVQLEIFKSFPHKEFHYLCILPIFKHYHGVEHHKNTVITLGPSSDFHQDDFYNNLLGVSSHELFHVWNIKQIRPKELLPYDLFKESYFDTGYVAEGVTTYYGDACLYRAGVFSETQYKKELNTLLDRHFENQGRFVKSVTDSSLELWVDGYEKGIPSRKTSIYVKGALVALMLDSEIQRITNNRKSLDDVMFLFNQQYGGQKKGYTSKDFQEIVQQVCGEDMERFFSDYVYGIKSLELQLKKSLEFLGWEVEQTNAQSKWMSDFGIKLSPNGEVVDIAYNNNEDIQVGDVFKYCEQQKVTSWENVLMNKEKIDISIERDGQILAKQLVAKKKMYYSKLSII